MRKTIITDKYEYSDRALFTVYTEQGKLCSVQQVLYKSERYVNLQSSGAFHRGTGIERGSTRYIQPATEEQIEQFHLLHKIQGKINWNTPLETLRQVQELLG
jgi:hypothetical protein